MGSDLRERGIPVQSGHVICRDHRPDSLHDRQTKPLTSGLQRAGLDRGVQTL